MKVVALVWVQQVDEDGQVWSAWYKYRDGDWIVEDRLRRTFKSAGRALDALIKWAEDRRCDVQISTVKLNVMRESVISLMHENNYGGKR